MSFVSLIIKKGNKTIIINEHYNEIINRINSKNYKQPTNNHLTNIDAGLIIFDYNEKQLINFQSAFSLKEIKIPKNLTIIDFQCIMNLNFSKKLLNKFVKKYSN